MRSIRRHHYNRLKQSRKHYWGGEDEQSDVTLGIKISAPKPVSTCQCCINPRKNGHITKQEQLSKLNFKEQLT